MASPTMGMRAPLFLAIWVVMMVAMMFPTAAPMILTFHQVQAGKRQRGETFVATWVSWRLHAGVAGGSLPPTLRRVAAEAIARAPRFAGHSARIGARPCRSRASTS